jgi:hypothetical protein
MIAAPLTVTSKRHQVIDFSQPFQIGNLGMVLRRTENSRQSVGDRLRRIWVPFESSVWLLTNLEWLRKVYDLVTLRCNC